MGDEAELDAMLEAEHIRVDLPERGAPDEVDRLRALVGQLTHALTTRPVINQAKGILMAQEGCTPDEAFDILREASQHRNRPLRDIAQELVERRRHP